MPSHPDRVRTASLPEGYQFGDSGKVYRPDGALLARGDRLVLDLPKRWRAPHLNAAERVELRYQGALRRVPIQHLDCWDRMPCYASLRPFTTDRDLGDEA